IESAGGLKLVYIDPPFNVGDNFYMEIPVGESCLALKRLAYADRWDGNYFNMLKERLLLIRELLADDGCVFAHCDWRTNAKTRLILDDIFGYFENEIIWHYTGGGRSSRRFSRKHDTILVYTKSGRLRFDGDAIRVPYKKSSGYARSGIRAKSGKRYLPNPAGAIPDDVWHIPIVNPLSPERSGYPTQKPESLIERVILSCSREGDLVADFFCGSGVFPAVAAKFRRGWIAVDSGKLAVDSSKKRILANTSEVCFDVLEAAPATRRVSRILDCYGAMRTNDRLFQGWKDGRPVAVVHGIATPDIAKKIILRCRRDGGRAVDILATGFAAGLLPGILAFARENGANLRLLRIPDPLIESVPTAGDLVFYPASWPETSVEFKNGKLAAKLTGYKFSESPQIIPLCPSGEALAKNDVLPLDWREWIDYWAVDYKFIPGEIFRPAWTSFRTKNNTNLKFLADSGDIPTAGRKIAVKTIDILGLEARAVIDVNPIVRSPA
ncbi:MAG: site-specific DNA-methyltransferase, partial [Desulfovibrio sp.]|nr:site-specific DNA-methyltransferase [Desulfovibrio sp.]